MAELSPENFRKLKCNRCKKEKDVIYFFDLNSLYKGNRTCLACNPRIYNFNDPYLELLEEEEKELDLQKPSYRTIIEE